MSKALTTAIPTTALPANAISATPVRLVQLVTRLDTGGVPEHVLALLAGLAQHGYELTVVCREVSPRYRVRLETLGVRIILLDMRRLISPVADLRAAWHLYRLLRDGRCQVLHMHMSKAALLGGLVGLAARVPVRVNTAHNLGCVALPQRALRALFWAYDKLLFAMTMHAVITVSSRIRQTILHMGLLGRDKAHAIPNGIDPAPFEMDARMRDQTRQTLGLAAGEVAIGCVARLVWFKGLDALVDAIPCVTERHPQARFFIAGEGPLKSQLIEQAHQRGVADKLVFLGERNDVAALLAAFDVFVLPSVSEGMPITILEAMAAGLPTVATDVGGVGEMIVDQVSGLLVAPRAPDALAAALNELVGNPARCKSMGAAARTRLDQHFAQDGMVAATDRLYRQKLHERGLH